MRDSFILTAPRESIMEEDEEEGAHKAGKGVRGVVKKPGHVRGQSLGQKPEKEKSLSPVKVKNPSPMKVKNPSPMKVKNPSPMKGKNLPSPVKEKSPNPVKRGAK